MDAKDREILTLLQEDAQLTQAELGRRVGLSASSVNERIRKLERDGLIRKWTVLVDDQRAGAEITVFIEVSMEAPEYEPEFVARLRDLPEVQECHFVTGAFTFLVKAKVPNRHALRELIVDRINSIGGVRQTRSYIALETFKEEPTVVVPPVAEQGRDGARSG